MCLAVNAGSTISLIIQAVYRDVSLVFVFKLSDPDDPSTAKAVAQIVSDDTELGLLD